MRLSQWFHNKLDHSERENSWRRIGTEDRRERCCISKWQPHERYPALSPAKRPSVVFQYRENRLGSLSQAVFPPTNMGCANKGLPSAELPTPFVNRRKPWRACS